MKVSHDEALAFCREVWFPELVLGADEVEARLDRLLKLYTPQARLADPNYAEVRKGHDEIRQYYRAVLTSYPEWKFEIRAIYPTEKGFVLHYTGRNAPPVDAFEGVDILEIERGPAGSGPEDFRIARLEGFYDRLPFAK